MVTYLYKTNENSPGTIFKVKDVEKMYIDELAVHDISVTTHVTPFSLKLITAIDDLVAKSENNIVTVCFSQTIDNLYWEHYSCPETFIKQLREIVEPIRASIFEQQNKFEGQFDEDSQIKSVPVRLLTLMSFLIDGVCGGTNSVGQETLTCSQYIVSNCKKKRQVVSTYHSKKRDTPVLIYTSLKRKEKPLS